jgi:cation transport regulator ChaB
MPYDSVKALPKYVKKYSAKIQRMWLVVFNSTYKKVLKETGSKKQAEERAFKAANSKLKKNMSKFGSYRYGERSHIMYLVDKFLGNLQG